MRSREALFLPSFTLMLREIVRFYRQKGRVIGALLTPVLFWVVIGSGLGRSFHSSGLDSGGYLEFFFPGVIVMILLFTAIFSMISLIEDRREGFLQAVLVAPVSRGSIVLGKAAGATAIAVFQALLFTLLAPVSGFSVPPGMFFTLALLFALISFPLTFIGFLIAWRARSVQSFHVIMNLLLFPMWLLSGATFPSEGAPKWLEFLMAINPMTYGVAVIRHALYGFRPIGGIPPFSLSIAVLAVSGTVLFAWSLVEVNRRRSTLN